MSLTSGTARTQVYSWNNVVKSNEGILNITHIHPYQQKTVGEIVRFAEQCSTITKVIIFGSSTYPCCNTWSDVDVYTEGTYETLELYKHLSKDHAPLDRWGSEDVDETLLQEIMNTGVKVYEKL